MQTTTPPPLAPGGPFGLGHLIAFARDPLEHVEELRRVDADVVATRVGPWRALTLFHPDAVHELLVARWRDFRKLPWVVEMLRRSLGEGLVTTEGDAWLAERRHLAPLFAAPAVGRFARIAGRLIDEHVRALPADAPFDADRAMSALALAITLEAVLGVELPGAGEELASAHAELASAASFEAVFLGHLPRWLPAPALRRARRGLERLGAVADGIAREWARGQPEPDAPAAVLARTPGGEPAAPAVIRDRLFTMLNATYGTTSTAMTWLVKALSDDLPLQERLRAGDEALAERVAREVLRAYPPGWVLIPRQAVRDTELAGRPVPAGTWINVYPYAVHHDPRWYPDPGRLDPDRFLPERAATLPAGAYLPFGAGPHVCAGQALGLAVLSGLARALARHAIVRRSGPPVAACARGPVLRPRGAVMVRLERML